MYNSHVNKENLGVTWLHHINNWLKPDFWSIKSILHFKTIHSCVEICGFPCEKMQGFEESSMSNEGVKINLRNPVVLTGKHLIRLGIVPPQGNPTSTFRSKSSSMLILTWQLQKTRLSHNFSLKSHEHPWKPTRLLESLAQKITQEFWVSGRVAMRSWSEGIFKNYDLRGMVRLVQIATILKGFVTLCHHFPFQV